MYAIRGATTVDGDTEIEVITESRALLNRIAEANSLNKNDIVSIVISTTSDIKSYYPAKAIREAGYENTPLFSCIEPDITGSLRLCIRLLITVDVDRKNVVPKHIYLKKAALLRPDLEGERNA